MKLATLLLIFTIMQVSATTFAQKVTLSEKNAPITKVLTQIKSQTGYDFVFTGSMLKNIKPITINVKDAELDDVLKLVFKGSSLDFAIDDKSVVLSQKMPSFLDKVVDPFQAIDVRGKVIDETGQPLIGATVKVKGTDQSTTTDSKGYFSLSNVKDDAIISVSFIGYETQELKSGRDLTFTMKPTTSNLQEVVVNKGYYTESRELSVGSVGSVSAKTIAQQPVSNPLAALQGRVPGLDIVQTSGLLGSNFTVQIRGKGSLINGSDPLFVIDGVPYAPGNTQVSQVSLLQSSNNSSPLNFINPNDIESIDVLKDADATSIYGSRGANGVILITTKKGKAGKTAVSANVYTGFSQVAKLPEMMNTEQYLQMRKEAFANDKVTPTLANAKDLLAWDQKKYTNWGEQFKGYTGHSTDANVSISGGTNSTQFLLGTTYRRETPVYPKEANDQRAAVNLSINHESIDQRFKLALKTIYTSDKSLPINAINLPTQLRLSPNAPDPYDENGQLYWGTAAAPFENPYGPLTQVIKINTQNLVSNLTLSYNLLKGLIIKSSLGYNTVNVNDYSGTPIKSLNPFTATSMVGSAEFGSRRAKTFNFEPQIEYNTGFLGKGKLAALAGGTYSLINTQTDRLSLTGYSNDALLESTATGAAATTSDRSNGYTDYKYAALYGRLNLNWADKYILNLTGREDGSSRFGPERRYNFFGSVGAGWLFSKESWMQNLSFLSFGKIRASYGVTGNDQIGDYNFLDTWGPAMAYNGVNTLKPSRLFNPEYNWERNRKLEFGLDLEFFKSRLYVSADYFLNRMDNQLVQYNLPATTGFSSILQNLPAKIQNAGFELSIGGAILHKDKLKWDANVVLTIPKNKLVAFPGIESSPYNTTYFVGRSLSTINQYQFTGLNTTTGLYTFQDVNNDGVINGNDYLPSTNTDPKFYGGLQNTLSYLGFELTVFFQFRKAMGLNYLGSSNFNPGTMNNLPIAFLDHWQKAGDDTPLQAYTQTSGAVATGYSNFRYSTGAYSDAGYIRLKNVSISYQIPQSLWKNNRAKVFVQGQNLLTFTGYKIGDPETTSWLNIPPLRTLTLGFNANF